MGRLTLRLPDTLHKKLEQTAKNEGVSLNQFIVYALTQQTASPYTIQMIPEDEAECQSERISAYMQNLRSAPMAEIEQTLAERELVEPEDDLDLAAVAIIRQEIAQHRVEPKDAEHKDAEHKDAEHKDAEHKDAEHKDVVLQAELEQAEPQKDHQLQPA